MNRDEDVLLDCCSGTPCWPSVLANALESFKPSTACSERYGWSDISLLEELWSAMYGYSLGASVPGSSRRAVSLCSIPSAAQQERFIYVQDSTLWSGRMTGH